MPMGICAGTLMGTIEDLPIAGRWLPYGYDGTDAGL